MKKIIGVVLGFITVCCIGGGWLYLSNQRETAPQPAVELTRLATDYLPGTVITPATTEELRAWFSEATNREMPRIFVEKLPADFAEKGEPGLFLQVMATLIMRENELAVRERVALIALKTKFESGIAWSAEESAFFNRLVDKYDAGAKRDVPSKIADLMNKVDVVPVSLAVAMAAEATNWGTENTEHPFRQQGWLDNQTYGLIPFETLPEAVAAYVREMNGMPPLMEWRISRNQYRNMLHVPDMGYRLIRWIKNYMPWDADYADKVRHKADKMDVVAMDALTFLPEIPPYKTVRVTITTNQGSFPITAEVTEEDWQRRRGLMFRDTLADNHGMLFLFPEVREAGVWMKNTFIPLDVLFFDADGKISHMVANARPLDETVHSSDGAAAGMLELPAGSIERMNIRVGDSLSYDQ